MDEGEILKDDLSQCGCVLTENRETIEALTVSALQQAHEMSHRPETKVEKLLPGSQGHNSDVKGPSSSETARFPGERESLRRSVRGRVACWTTRHVRPWVDTMKTPTMWRSKYTARCYEEPHSDEGCFAATATIQGIRMHWARCLDKRDQGHEACVADYTQAFLNAEVREGEQRYAQPPEAWNPKIPTDGRRAVWRVHKAMLGLKCVGCAIVKGDHAPDCGVAQGVIHGVVGHHGKMEEEVEEELGQEVKGQEEENSQTPVRMTLTMDEMEKTLRGP